MTQNSFVLFFCLSSIRLIINMNNQESSFYLFFRNVVKYVYHKLTGQTEIERIARNGEVKPLQRSIALSKMLVGYRDRHCHWTEPYHNDFCEQLCSIKQIANNDSKFRVSVVLKELHSWKYAITEIERLRTTRYNSESQQHQKLLLEVWDHLRPNREIKARKSSEWIELGFQADDPATDFRGSGFLGLLNLHGWISKDKGKEAFKVADTQGTDYFFASASIYLTMLTVQLIKQMLIPPMYWVTKKGESISQLLQILFELVFSQFAVYWLEVQDKSLMQFNANLIAFSKQVKQAKIRTICESLLQKRLQ